MFLSVSRCSKHIAGIIRNKFKNFTFQSPGESYVFVIVRVIWLNIELFVLSQRRSVSKSDSA